MVTVSGTTTELPGGTAAWAWRLALGAVAGPVLFTIVWVVLGFVSDGYQLWDQRITGYSPISQPVSGLGMGATAPYMNGAFIVNGLLGIAGAIGIASAIPGLDATRRRAVAALLGLHGVGSIVDGLFDLEAIMLHLAGFVLALSPIVTFPIVARWLRGDAAWERLGSALRIASPLTLVLALWYFATFDPVAAGTGAGIAGLIQRILIGQLQCWFVALGWTAHRTGRGQRWPAARRAT